MTRQSESFHSKHTSSSHFPQPRFYLDSSPNCSFPISLIFLSHSPVIASVQSVSLIPVVSLTRLLEKNQSQHPNDISDLFSWICASISHDSNFRFLIFMQFAFSKDLMVSLNGAGIMRNATPLNQVNSNNVDSHSQNQIQYGTGRNRMRRNNNSIQININNHINVNR